MTRAARALVAVGTVLVAGSALAAGRVAAAPPAQGDVCSSIGWVHVEGLVGSFSTLAASPSGDRVYAGSRRIGQDPSSPDRARATLYSGAPGATIWAAEAVNLRVTDTVVTPGRAADVWVSTFGADASFDGPVLGGRSGEEFLPMGSLQSWHMRLVATADDVFSAVSKPAGRGVYRWDAAALPVPDWQLAGGADIPSDYFHAFAAGSNGRLWLGTDRQGVWTSDDGGRTWAHPLASGETVLALAIDPTDPRHVLAGLGYVTDQSTTPGTYPRGIRHSSDAGASWVAATPSRIASVPRVTSVVFGRSSLQTGRPVAYAAAWEDGLFVSADGGRSWERFVTPGGRDAFFEALLTVVPPGADCELLFAAGHDGVWFRNLADPPHRIFLPLAPRNVALQ